MDSFFVHRPVFAWVIAAFIALFGTMALLNLPIEQYPSVAPPSLTLAYTYNGADADTMDKNVTAVIERELNGVDNFLYMSSTSRANGTGELIVTFKSGTNLDVARTQVQDRLNRAEPRLPEDVRRLGIQITDNSSGFLEVIAHPVEDRARRRALELGDFASTKVRQRDPSRARRRQRRCCSVPKRRCGSGSIPKSSPASTCRRPTRCWRCRSRTARPQAAASATSRSRRGAEFNAKIVTQNRFQTPEQFRNIIMRANPDGSTVRLGDVARVEIGADNYQFKSTLNGKDVAGIGVQLATGRQRASPRATRSARG